nr:hypothetical protein [Tanacetum cinerariifolium]
MALPDKHQLKFSIHKDAKSLMEAIKKRFGGNKETKKVQKTLLKQQHKNFTGCSSESLYQIHDRLQKLIGQLEILGESLSQESINLKFLRSLPSEWRTHTLIWKNKANLEDQSLDDLFNNLKIYEAEVKISVVASVSVASTKPPASILPNVDNLSDVVIYSFFASQYNSPQLDNDDLKQIDVDDLEEMNLKWQMAMLTMRARRFLQRTRRNLGANGTTSIGFDMSKVKCYNCHRRGHLARKCRSPKDTRNKDTQRRSVLMETSISNALNENVFEEDIKLLKLDVMLRDNALVELRKKFEAAEKERDELKHTLEKFQTSSRNLSKLLASQITNKNGLGYDDQVFNSTVFDCDELNSYVSDVSVPTSPVYDRTTKPSKDMSHSNRPSAPIIEDWVFDSENEYEGKPMPTQKAPSFVQTYEHVKTPRTSIKPGNPQQDLKDKGVIDSGCSRHMTRNISYLSDFEEINEGYVAFGGNPKDGKITGKGKIKTGKLDFDDVYFFKELKFNLFNVSQMCDKKNNVLFTDTECVVLSSDIKMPDENHVLLRVPRESNMYNVDLKNIVPSGDLTFLFTKATLDESNIWHRRLGHIDFKIINKLVKGNLVRGLPLKVFENNHTCVACKKGKQDRASCKTKPVSSVSQPLQRLHMDLFGPTFVKSLNKKSYCLVVTDDYNPLEKFDGKADEGFLVGYSVSSKAFRVFNSRTRLVQETLHINFLENQPNITGSGPTWLFDIDTLTQSMNYQPVVAGINLILVQVSKEILIKNTNVNAAFDDKENESEVHVSPSSSDKPKKHDEKAKEKLKERVITPVTAVGPKSTNSTNSFSVAGPSNTAVSPSFEIGGKSSFVDPSQYPDDPNMHALEDIIYLDNDDDTRSMVRMVKEQGGLTQINNEDFYTCMFTYFLSQEEPKRVHQALKDPSWIEAMQEELLQFKMQKIWVLVDLPKGKRIIGSKWVFRNKKDKRGIFVRNKARLVAQGHTQEKGIDYEEVFAPVARIEAIRLFLAYASFMDFMVYKVVKALYGLHQAPRAWYETLANYLLVNDFQRGQIDQTLFKKKQKGDILLVRVYVDGIIFGSTNKELCKAFEKLMKDKFQMSSIGEITFVLGLQVKLKDNGIFISQDKYVVKILRKFGLTDGKSASTPIDTGKLLLKDPDGEDVDVHIYRYLKGKPHLGLWYPKDSPFNLVAYSDSDYAGASLDRKSTTGCCQFLGCRLISWQCKKQTVVATSSTKAEYVATTSCSAQLLWIQNYNEALTIPRQTATGKEKSNPFMADSLPKTILLTIHEICINMSPFEFSLVYLVVTSISKLMLFGLTIDVAHLMLLDKKKVIITDDTIRQALRLDDADGIDCLLNEEILAELARMGYEKPSTKLTFYNVFFSTQWKFLIHTILQCMSAKRTAAIAITLDLPTVEPEDSQRMGDEHLDTIPTTESDEFIKSSVENLVQNPNYDPEEEIRPIEKLLYDNSSPRPPEGFISENSDAAIESFSLFTIPVEDSDSFMKEIDLSFTPDAPMPLGIEEDDYDLERDILIFEELLSNDSRSLPRNESFHFDIPSFPRPPVKPPDDDSVILTVKVVDDISEHDVPMPRLLPTLVSNQEKSPHLLSHQGFKASQFHFECPMMIYGGNTPNMDALFFHFYPP